MGIRDVLKDVPDQYDFLEEIKKREETLDKWNLAGSSYTGGKS